MDKSKESFRLTLYIIGCIIVSLLIVKTIIDISNIKMLHCESSVEIEEGITSEANINFKWSYDRLIKAQTRHVLNTTEKITTELQDQFKQEIESNELYNSNTIEDYWSYKIVANSTYKIDKLGEFLGDSTFDTVKNYFENELLMTCEEKNGV